MLNLFSCRSTKSSVQAFGFTLVELMLVLVILGIVVGIAVPNFGPTYTNLTLNKSSQDLVFTMRFAQSRAVTKRVIHRLVFDGERRSYWLMEGQPDDEAGQEFEHVPGRAGRVVHVPVEVTIETQGAMVDFFPDGTMTKTKIMVHGKKRNIIISTQERKGHVSISELSP